MKKIANTLIALCTVTLSACAPQIGLRLSVPNIPEPQSAIEGSAAAEPIKVKVGSFSDGRPSDTIVLIDGRQVASSWLRR